MTDNQQRKPRGFQTLTPERMHEIASAGGKAAQASGTAHKFTPEEAREAGRKGGLARAARRPQQPVETPQVQP